MRAIRALDALEPKIDALDSGLESGFYCSSRIVL